MHSAWGWSSGRHQKRGAVLMPDLFFCFFPPQKQLMVIGMDVSHGRGTRSVIGFVASVNQYVVPSPPAPLFLPWRGEKINSVALAVPNPSAPDQAGEKRLRAPVSGWVVAQPPQILARCPQGPDQVVLEGGFPDAPAGDRRQPAALPGRCPAVLPRGEGSPKTLEDFGAKTPPDCPTGIHVSEQTASGQPLDWR